MRPWDRRPDEPAPAWSAFLVFRDLPPQARAVRTLIRHAKAQGLKIPLSHERIDEWMARFDWRSRAAAWDEYLAAERERAIISAAREAAVKQAQVAASALRVSEIYFRALLERMEDDALKKLDLRALLAYWGAAVRSFQIATQVLRLIGGEPTQRIATDAPVVRIEFSSYSDEELRAWLERLERAREIDSPALPETTNADGAIS